MSSTRHADPGEPLRQERYCSSPEFEKGLMGNLVAKRCEVLKPGEDRELIWFLQQASHLPGGLRKLAADLIAAFPARVATRTMQKHGVEASRVYQADQFKAIRSEIQLKGIREKFPLKGEIQGREGLLRYMNDGEEAYQARLKTAQREAASFPDRYKAAEFVEICRREAEGKLEGLLAELCLNPATAPATCAPWYFPTLIDSLRELKKSRCETSRAAMVVTELGRQVFKELDYAMHSRCLVVIDGLPRTGKTFATKAWCELHPGQARYVQVPSSNDDIGFFAAIARSVGVSVNQNSKAQQLRDRVEEVLQGGDLILVMDEAHYLFPQGCYREALPSRVNWIMTALVNYGVPVALVTTPQFMKAQKVVEKRTHWTSEQFTGRIGHYQKLPDSLSEADLKAVARFYFPDGDARSVETLATYARASMGYLAGIETVVRRARYLAQEESRSRITFADIKQTMQQSIFPSDSALAGALAEPAKKSRRMPRNVTALPMPQPRQTAALPAVAPARAITPAVEITKD
jgi:hypothetical protein